MNVKTILITGATAGIGKATADFFAKNNWRTILTGRREDRLKKMALELQKKYSTEVLSLCFDIRDKDACFNAIQNLPPNWENIDVLVNNAGLALGREGIDEGKLEDWDIMIDTNVKGLLFITKFIIPGMKLRKEGHIINLGSIAGKEVYKNGNVYCATKHAVDAITKGMRIDLLPYGIKVSSISPGMVETEFSEIRFKGDREKADKVYKGFTPLYAEDIADLIYYTATRPKHVCLNDVLILATNQANSTNTHRETH